MRTAQTERVDRLYHYQPLDLSRLEVIVRDRQIYFSKPSDFNDPWDGKPWFNITNLQDPEERARIADWLSTVYRELNLPDDERGLQCIRSDPVYAREKIEKFSNAMARGIPEKYRVYCLSTKPDCELMWAHYANKHRGICLEYNCSTPMFCEAYKISYSKTYPVFKIYNSQAEDNLMPLVTKSAAWAYEDEYLLISQEKNNASHDPTLITENGLLKLPEGALKAIIIGCLTAEDNKPIHDIRQVISDAGASVQLKCAVRKTDQYKLAIEAL